MVEASYSTPARSRKNVSVEVSDIPVSLHLELWAKTARGGRWSPTLRPDEATWHPLLAHLIDVAMVALRLWKYLLPPVVKRQLQESLELDNTDHAGRWIAFFAGLHDIGKGAPGFAYRWQEAEARLEAAGLRRAKSGEHVPHGFVSAYIIADLLHEWGLPKASAVAIGHAVGGHHGVFPDSETMMTVERAAGGRAWRESQRDLARQLATVLGIHETEPPRGNVLSDSAFLIRLAGLTAVADWIGSNHTYFPFVGDELRLPKYARRAYWQALKALLDLGWFSRPGKTRALPFNELFGQEPNALQSELLNVTANLFEPSLIILEYPMGGGKTEAALFAANALIAQAGHDGIFVGMPTMATSNQMFERFSDYLASRYPDKIINLQLMHGRADLNPQFARLVKRGKRLPDAPLAGDGRDLAANLVAAEWFTNKKQALLAPFGIGTIDQALLAALDTRHYFVRLFGLAGKVVVLDEVHAYDTYMQTLLCHLLSWLAACGSSVIMLSATLPRRTREQLVGAFSRGLGQLRGAHVAETPYPRITWVSRGQTGSTPVEGGKDRAVRLRHFKADETDWMRALRDRLQPGGCAAIICNTVGKAQAIYRALFDYFEPDELMLFHARYPFTERLARENLVLERFGRSSGLRPQRMVCVATQVIEQSLDIDFDLMVTELAPVDLILQRSGRIWRHDRQDRPAHLPGPELWLLMPHVTTEGVPALNKSSTSIYDAHVLLRSFLVLREREAIAVPCDVELLVESVYSSAEPPGSLSMALQEFWRASATHLFHDEIKHRRQAEIREIPALSVDLIDYRQRTLADDDPQIHSAHQALTRLGGPSVDVICLFEKDGKAYLTSESDEPVAIDEFPDAAGIMAILGRSVRIAFDPELVRRILDLPVPASWAAIPHLRRHRLLLFATDGSCLTGNLPLVLDPELGLLQLRTERR